ncbi:hypothetical protein SIID45300_00888 [Candidatus Magnetaquicoccaceae bacterium FCR-1]|uniref:Uncharacterized protein n=1 Tax=Candidatus Magnetaquiglobus chichijimensis TaxID=3141448 RepID=A0ABQ0C6T1_9PROT
MIATLKPLQSGGYLAKCRFRTLRWHQHESPWTRGRHHHARFGRDGPGQEGRGESDPFGGGDRFGQRVKADRQIRPRRADHGARYRAHGGSGGQDHSSAGVAPGQKPANAIHRMGQGEVEFQGVEGGAWLFGHLEHRQIPPAQMVSPPSHQLDELFEIRGDHHHHPTSPQPQRQPQRQDLPFRAWSQMQLGVIRAGQRFVDLLHGPGVGGDGQGTFDGGTGSLQPAAQRLKLARLQAVQVGPAHGVGLFGLAQMLDPIAVGDEQRARRTRGKGEKTIPFLGKGDGSIRSEGDLIGVNLPFQGAEETICPWNALGQRQSAACLERNFAAWPDLHRPVQRAGGEDPFDEQPEGGLLLLGRGQRADARFELLETGDLLEQSGLKEMFGFRVSGQHEGVNSPDFS